MCRAAHRVGGEQDEDEDAPAQAHTLVGPRDGGHLRGVHATTHDVEGVPQNPVERSAAKNLRGGWGQVRAKC